MCGLLPLAADSFRCGMQCFAVSIEPRGPTSNIRLNLRALKSSVACGKMALAQLIRMSMPPNFATASPTAASIESSSRTSTMQPSAPAAPSATHSSAAV